jgi:hypothetical protein
VKASSVTTILDVTQLLLENSAFVSRCLLADAVGQHHAEMMVAVCVEQGGTPPAQTPVINAALFHVTYKFAAEERPRAPWLVTPYHFMPVMSCVSAHVGNFISEP